MNRKLMIVLAMATLPAAAQAEVTVYGKVNVGFQQADKANNQKYTELVNHASRLGFKGSESISSDLKMIYLLEYEVRPDDGTSPFGQRNIYVGLQGSSGTLMGGHFDTPLKLVQEKVDLFDNMIGDFKYVMNGDLRAKNIVQYSTPAFSNITANLAYISAEKDVPNISNGYSASLVYNTAPLYLAIGLDRNAEKANSTPSQAAPASPHDTDILRAVARYTIGPVNLGAIWENYDDGIIDEDGILVSALWNFNTTWAGRFQIATSDMIAKGSASMSLGVDYKLSKTAKVFGYYTALEDDLSADGKSEGDYLGVGVEMNF